MRERQEPMTQTMKAMEARQQWSKLLNQVFRRETRVVVERSGIPVAAVVSIEDLNRLQRLEEQREGEFQALWRTGEAFKDVPDEEIEREVGTALTPGKREQILRSTFGAWKGLIDPDRLKQELNELQRDEPSPRNL